MYTNMGSAGIRVQTQERQYVLVCMDAPGCNIHGGMHARLHANVCMDAPSWNAGGTHACMQGRIQKEYVYACIL